MCQPRWRLRVRRPVARGALDAIEHGEQASVVAGPALQQAPLAQQCLVRRLYGGLTGVLGDVSGQEALLDEQVDQRPNRIV